MRREKRGSREAGTQSGLKPHGEHSPGRDGLEERGLVGADMLKSSTAGVVDVHQWEVEVGPTSGEDQRGSLAVKRRASFPQI